VGVTEPEAERVEGEVVKPERERREDGDAYRSSF
jgi:hypothetical protein